MEGVPVKPNESINDVESATRHILESKFNAEKNSIEREFDKAHRVGPVYNGHQRIIMRFKSHSFPNRIYNSRKKCNDRKFKLRPSLTKRREKLLNDAREKLSSHGSENFAFAFSDMKGNLKIRVHNKINNRNVFSFKNHIDLADIIFKVNGDSDRIESMCFDEFDVIDNNNVDTSIDIVDKI